MVAERGPKTCTSLLGLCPAWCICRVGQALVSSAYCHQSAVATHPTAARGSTSNNCPMLAVRSGPPMPSQKLGAEYGTTARHR